MAESQLRVGKLAARAGVGVQTLHYYERLGLLPKPNRSTGNYRLYPPATLRRVEFIKKCQTLGFTLEEIKEILGLRGQGRSPCRCVADVGKKHLQELDARIAVLQEFRRALAAIVPKWEKATSHQRKCAGEFCDLIERLPRKLPLEPTSKKLKKSLPL
ncbi:MAG TPA: heavy metal-responsive transcriptional regulator [Candidatus Binatia bacterium]|nr:heavy metal-responsive transcriptional regulator [Candidatus Binatia bacterium]